MNTPAALHEELAALAEHAPTEGDVRATLDRRIEAHARRRRTSALVAVAAAVVLVAGGAGITGAVLSHRSTGPAAPTPVVSVPDVPLPPNSKLIRHELQPVTSPVTATPPKGLTGHAWMSAPGRLAVSYFNPASAQGAGSGGMMGSGPQSGTGTNGVVTAGYTITSQRDGDLRSYGPDGPTTPTVTRTPITVGGHAATLDTAPSDTNDDFGFPAAERISWRLTGGRWIHVWTQGLGDKGALESFAATIAEKPHTLNRTLGIGLTLPGLTVDSSMNSWPAVSYIGASVFLCPKGVDPMAPTYSSSSGSSSSGPDGADSGTTVDQSTSQDPQSWKCVTAIAMKAPDGPAGLKDMTTVTVGQTVVHVDPTVQAGWVDLGDGVLTMAGAPRGMHLSDADLAALAASVRLSPAATVLSSAVGQVVEGGSGGTMVVSATPEPAPAQSTAATSRPAESASDPSPGAPATGEPSSRLAETQPAQDPATAAAQRDVITGYLDAVKVRDCAKADTYWLDGKAQPGNGDLCHAGTLRLTDYRIDGPPATPSPDEAEFAVTITTTGGDVSMPPGDTVWFLDLHRQPSGDWRITGGGTGP